ncbi:SufS family cysteine desulfurase [Eggerthellaceae bacterium zg-1084]|uniref:SufS family cysteine desulfurase n=1 Tax=Berryella wangjianweii TaxID=2734634 RepID=UPI001555DD50|nr:SufS family cysteine desulfurase [Berryella wangjianweii]NPD30689.1 SufS family cysteine desulfurase [Berryella wangjianweii]
MTAADIDIVANPYKADFPLLAGKPALSFLDSAATAQRPACVLEAQKRFYETMNANPLRGLYGLSVEATQAIERARGHVARFIGAADPREVVFGRNASEMLNLIAHSYAGAVLSAGDEVCISVMEHHSNLIPWQQACRRAGATLVYLRPNEHGLIDEAEMRAKIGPRTKIVSCLQVSNVLGSQVDVGLMARIAHEAGAVMVVDGAQSVPHLPVDVAQLDCDFFAFSGHKVYGPMGVGVLWGRRELLELMEPLLTGGEMIDAVTEQDATWAPIPEKFETGTQDAAGMHALDVALDYVERVGLDAIAARERALVAYGMERLGQLDFVEVLGSSDPANHHGVISFNVKGVHPHDVSSVLDIDDVAIRAGHHCAQPLLAWMGADSCCRASLAFYNDASDIDALVEGLNKVWSMFHGQ